MDSVKLEERIKSLNDLIETAREADVKLIEKLRRMALEVFEKVYKDEKYLQSSARLAVLSPMELLSSIFTAESDLARQIAVIAKNIREENKIKLEKLKQEAEKAILNMKPAELYAFFKNPSSFLNESAKR